MTLSENKGTKKFNLHSLFSKLNPEVLYTSKHNPTKNAVKNIVFACHFNINIKE